MPSLRSRLNGQGTDWPGRTAAHMKPFSRAMRTVNGKVRVLPLIGSVRCSPYASQTIFEGAGE